MTPTERLNQLKNEYAQSQDKRRFDEWLVDKLIEVEQRAQRYETALEAIIDAASILDFVESSNSIQIKQGLGFARSKARYALKKESESKP